MNCRLNGFSSTNIYFWVSLIKPNSMDADKAFETMINNMPEKTGKSLEEWLVILKNENFEKHGLAVKFLKTEHGVTHGYANTIVALSRKTPESNTVDLVANQYKGKEHLAPIYALLKKKIQAFGKDVEFAPKKTYVSIRRNKQFALIQPSTKKRIDLGINLKGKAPEGKIEASGSFNAMVSHRVRLESKEDVTKDVLAWLKEAYQNA